MRWQETISRLFIAADPYLAARGDREHTRVVHQMAVELLVLEGGNKYVVEPAAILHDVGWSALTPQQIPLAFGIRAHGEEAEKLRRIHEAEGALIAQNILTALGYAPALTHRITAIIERHDTGRTADSIEEAIVKDADKLWRYSKIGFWKEQQRQNVNTEELLQNRVDQIDRWFFTASAEKMARKELQNRHTEVTSNP